MSCGDDSSSWASAEDGDASARTSSAQSVCSATQPLEPHAACPAGPSESPQQHPELSGAVDHAKGLGSEHGEVQPLAQHGHESHGTGPAASHDHLAAAPDAVPTVHVELARDSIGQAREQGPGHAAEAVLQGSPNPAGPPSAGPATREQHAGGSPAGPEQVAMNREAASSEEQETDQSSSVTELVHVVLVPGWHNPTCDAMCELMGCYITGGRQRDVT